MNLPTDRIDSFVFDAIKRTRLPGLGLGIVKGSELVYAKGFGFRDLESGLPVTPDTLFGIASITKSFTALALFQLQEKGLLDLDDPVSKYIPFSIEPFGEPVRLRHFVTHTSGIPALAFAEAVLRREAGASDTLLPISDPSDMLAFMDEAGDWAHSRPGERYFYLNEGYVLLGAVIERVSGVPYIDYVRDQILGPLGMNRSCFTRSDAEERGDVSTPYATDRDGRHIAGSYAYGKITSEGGLLSSVNDMARYIAMYLEQGKGSGGRILSEESFAAMTTGQVDLDKKLWPASSAKDTDAGADAGMMYAHGLQRSPSFFGRTLIGHSGSVLAATSHMGFIPEAGIGVVVLANGDGYPPKYMAQYVLATALGEDPERLPWLRAERALRAYQGVYETYKGTTRVEVRRDGDFLMVESPNKHGSSTSVLIPEQLGEERSLFFTLSGGTQVPVEFIRAKGAMELVFERYKYRRTGLFE